MIFATHSTHKLLAGISQASQIIVQESETRKLDRHIFNEAYLMHTSTSPQYAIIASCDVAAAMMEPPGGTALVEESIIEALDFRRAMRKVDDEWGKDWWFKVWGPEKLAAEGIGDARRLDAAGEREVARLRQPRAGLQHARSDQGHGHHPGPRRVRQVRQDRHPGGDRHQVSWPSTASSSRRPGLYSFFIMFTIGITKGRWNTLVTALQQFKDDYDKNQPLWRDPAGVRRQASALRADRPARPVPADPRHLQGATTSRA